MKNINDLLVQKKCNCGKIHSCDIKHIIIEENAINKTDELLEGYKNILLVADNNTYTACKNKLDYLFTSSKYKLSKHIFNYSKILVPNEEIIEELKSKVTSEIDLIIGVGSGVINDLCKYVSFINNLPYFIIATAPSMDGYASTGSALIVNNMKVNYSTHVPTAIIADISVLKNAPMNMIQAGFGDIIGKFSALNDWKLSKIINDEYFCDYVYDLTYACINKTISLASGLLVRNPESISSLMEALVIVGINMSYVGNSRPASGSEHHLSHFFEIVGLINNKKHLAHGIDVAYSTVITCKLREYLSSLSTPFTTKNFSKTNWINNINFIYKHVAPEIISLQEKVGWYSKDLISIYNEKWDQIKKVLLECPKSEYIKELLSTVNLNFDDFVAFYSSQEINTAITYAKDLKDRYTILWLYYMLCESD